MACQQEQSLPQPLWLLFRNIPGAILIGIVVTMLIGIPLGVTEFKGVVSAPESVGPIFWQFASQAHSIR